MVRQGLGIEVGRHGGGVAGAVELDQLGLGCKEERAGSILYGMMTWDERQDGVTFRSNGGIVPLLGKGPCRCTTRLLSPAGPFVGPTT